MRTGAIFARGTRGSSSCRALKWMALVGVVFALGAGQAIAQKPGPPRNLKAMPGDTEVKLTWDLPGDLSAGPTVSFEAVVVASRAALDAQVLLAVGAGDWVAVALSGKSTETHTFTALSSGSSLSNDTEYWFAVRSVGSDTAPNDKSAPVITRATPRSAPSVPSGLTAAMGDNPGEVKLTWSEPTVGDVDYHEYRYVKGSTFPSATAGWMRIRSTTRIAATSMLSTTVSGLENGFHTFELRAVKFSVPSSSSASDTVTVVSKPSAPRNLKVEERLNTAKTVLTVSLSWDAPADDGGSAISSYDYSYTGVGWINTGSTGLSVEVTGLIPATEYVFQVRARNGAGFGPAVSSDGTTTTGGPTGPTPTATGEWAGEYTPGAAAIKVTLSGSDVGTLSVQGNAAKAFTVGNAIGVTVTSVSVGVKTITLTLSKALESSGPADAQRYTLAYDGGDVTDHIIETGPSTQAAAILADEAAFRLKEIDVAPMLPADLDEMYTFTMGKELAEEALPVATGGNPGTSGMLTYKLGRQSDPIPGVEFDTTSRKFTGTPTKLGTYPVYYEVTDGNEALNPAATPPDEELSAIDDADVVKLTINVVADDTIDPGTGMYGRVTSTMLTGVEQKTIGNVLRNHVGEGNTGVELAVKVAWLASELRAIYGSAATLTGDDAYADLTVGIVSDSTMTTAWASMIDDQQDVHFPESTVVAGVIQSIVKVKYPAKPGPAVDDDKVSMATGELRVYILEDDFEAENEVFRIDVLSSNDVDVDARGSRPNTSTMVTVIEDDEVQTVKLSGSKRVMEDAGKAEYTVVADPERYDLPLEVRLDLVSFEDGTVVRGDKYSLSDASPTLNAAGTGGTAANTAKVTLEFPANDGDRMDNAYKLQATAIDYSLASGLDNVFKEQEHPVTLVDVHKLPRLTVSAATDTVKEDGEITLTLMLDREIRESGFAVQKATSEPVTVMLTAGAGTTAGNREYELPAVAVAFPKPATGETTQTMTAMVKATMDDVLGEADVLVVDAEVDGTVAANGPNDPAEDVYKGAFMLTIEDGTTPLVYANPQAELDAAVKAAKDAAMGADGMFTDGEMIKLMGSALFGAVPGTTVIYSAKSSDVTVASASVTGGEIVVEAEGKGDAMITVEASASTPAGVTINKQTEADRASIDIPVSVGLEALAITLEGPDAGMNLVEGMSYTLTANANRAVEMDTMVELVQTDGTAAPADYKVEPITIKMGESMGTAKLMVEDDGMMENEGNMAEMLTLEGRVGTMKTNSLMFYLWDAAVPALPIIAQLLLAAFLALGGCRRYLRR